MTPSKWVSFFLTIISKHYWSVYNWKTFVWIFRCTTASLRMSRSSKGWLTSATPSNCSEARMRTGTRIPLWLESSRWFSTNNIMVNLNVTLDKLPEHPWYIFTCRVRSRCTLCPMTLVFLLRPVSSESYQKVGLRSALSGFMWSEE